LLVIRKMVRFGWIFLYFAGLSLHLGNHIFQRAPGVSLAGITALSGD